MSKYHKTNKQMSKKKITNQVIIPGHYYAFGRNVIHVKNEVDDLDDPAFDELIFVSYDGSICHYTDGDTTSSWIEGKLDEPFIEISKEQYDAIKNQFRVYSSDILRSIIAVQKPDVLRVYLTKTCLYAVLVYATICTLVLLFFIFK